MRKLCALLLFSSAIGLLWSRPAAAQTAEQLLQPSEQFVKLPSTAPPQICTATLTARQIANIREVGQLSPLTLRCRESGPEEAKLAAMYRREGNEPYALFHEGLRDMSRGSAQGDLDALNKLYTAESVARVRLQGLVPMSDELRRGLASLGMLTEYWSKFVRLNPSGAGRKVRLTIP